MIVLCTWWHGYGYIRLQHILCTVIYRHILRIHEIFTVSIFKLMANQLNGTEIQGKPSHRRTHNAIEARTTPKVCVEYMCKMIFINVQCIFIAWLTLSRQNIWAISSCLKPENGEYLKGFFCLKESQTIILEGITTCRHRCTQTGLDKNCQVITYNTENHICMMQAHPCPVLQPNSTFTIQLLTRNPD